MTYEVLQERRRRGELGLPPLDEANRRRYFPHLPVRPLVRFWDGGEGQVVLDLGDEARPTDREPTPTWHFRGRRG